ncbi:O-methyltransferase [Streptomyces himastatinicus ATCC 53653]|uniref:O-methyltransferase n=1 Tax=Streptomyces himastatinicus ATCC 53653 TaxID=457427 RepID=D9WNX8_9ACTN|nr:methyltransferase [Streptomyces himastatinicus]EFL27951.1 O-methyltransferase [Streptomyces himastatinicus ATCC 53653]
MHDGHAARQVVDIITGSWQSQALYAAVALEIPDHIAAGHTTDTALATATGSGPDGITRLMRLLLAMGVFDRSPEHGYALTPVSEVLRADNDASMRDMIQLYGEEFHTAWGAVVPAVRTGSSGFEHALGTSIHAYLANAPGAGAKFQRAMNAGNVFFPDVLDAFDFSRCTTVMDVAGGSGQFLSMVLRAHPHLHGVLLDLPHMIPVAHAHLDAAVGPDRYEAVEGDIFASVPEGADAYLLSRVLQDWDDDRSVTLLSNIRKALPEDGRLLVVERVIPEEGAPELLPLLYDLHLLMAAGGRGRTLDGYRDVLTAAGLRLESVHPLALETTLLVAAAA